MSHDPAKQSAWEKEQALWEKIKTAGTMANYLTSINRSLNDFYPSPAPHTCVCMDEGTAFLPLSKYYMAGSGILYPAADHHERLQKVAELYLKNQVTTVSAHAGCGAASLAKQRDNFAGTADDYGQTWSQELVQRMHQIDPNFPVAYKFISADQLVRPIDFHTARCVYVDAIGGFQPTVGQAWPLGFVIGWQQHDLATYSWEEVKVAINIAFGHHGFGAATADYGFSPTQPLWIVPLATTPEALATLQSQLRAVIDTFPEFTPAIHLDPGILR